MKMNKKITTAVLTAFMLINTSVHAAWDFGISSFVKNSFARASNYVPNPFYLAGGFVGLSFGLLGGNAFYIRKRRKEQTENSFKEILDKLKRTLDEQEKARERLNNDLQHHLWNGNLPAAAAIVRVGANVTGVANRSDEFGRSFLMRLTCPENIQPHTPNVLAFIRQRYVGNINMQRDDEGQSMSAFIVLNSPANQQNIDDALGD